jgi:prefoldin subunit 5
MIQDDMIQSLRQERTIESFYPEAIQSYENALSEKEETIQRLEKELERRSKFMDKKQSSVQWMAERRQMGSLVGWH